MTPAPAKVVSTPELAVLERRLRVIGVLGQGPGVDLGGQRGQVFLAGPGPGRGDQDVIGGRAALARQLAGPAADDPGHRLGHRAALGQRQGDLRVGHDPVGPARQAQGRALGHPGAVDQPRGRAVVGVFAVSLARGERAQEPGPRRGGDRAPARRPAGTPLGPARPTRWGQPRPGSSGRRRTIPIASAGLAGVAAVLAGGGAVPAGGGTSLAGGGALLTRSSPPFSPGSQAGSLGQKGLLVFYSSLTGSTDISGRDTARSGSRIRSLPGRV